MGYIKTTWIDRVVQYANRYVDQNNTQYTFTPDPGTITQSGTSVSASNMNNLEDGVYKANVGRDLYLYNNIGGAL